MYTHLEGILSGKLTVNSKVPNEFVLFWQRAVALQSWVLERHRQFQSWLATPETQQRLRGIAQVAGAIHGSLTETRRRFGEAKGLPDYQALLEKHGMSPVQAKYHALMIQNLGPRLVEDARAEHDAAKILRGLGRLEGPRLSVVVRLAGEFLRISGYNNALQTLVKEAGESSELAHEMKFLLEKAAQGDHDAALDLAKRAKTLRPKIRPRKGTPIGVETAMHLIFLWCAEQVGYRPKGTRRDGEGFTDPATRATEASAGVKNFDPRPAVRAFPEFKRRLTGGRR